MSELTPPSARRLPEDRTPVAEPRLNGNAFALTEMPDQRRWWDDVIQIALGPLLGVLAFWFLNGFKWNLTGDDGIKSILTFLVTYILSQHLIHFYTSIREGNRNDARYRSIVAGFDELKREALDSFAALDKGVRVDIATKETEILQAIGAGNHEIRNLFRQLNVSIVPEADIQERITSAVISARLVKNTFVSMKHITGMKSHDANDIISRYENFLRRGPGVEWIDIIGVDDFMDERFHHIFGDSTREPLGRHNVCILDSNTPIVNFLLCASDDAQFSDLFFGWISNQAQGLEVFHTKDQLLINMFNNYFLQLIRDGRIINVNMNYEVTRDERFRDFLIPSIIGRWVCLTVAPPGRRASMLGSQDDELSAMVSHQEISDRTYYSVISISHGENWVVSGQVYHNDRVMARLVCDETVMMGDAIYYKFEQRTVNGDNLLHEGFGRYTIDLGESVPRLSGCYVHVRQNKNRIREIQGIKVPNNFRASLQAVRTLIKEGPATDLE
jgi:hypothetical protein